MNQEQALIGTKSGEISAQTSETFYPENIDLRLLLCCLHLLPNSSHHFPYTVVSLCWILYWELRQCTIWSPLQVNFLIFFFFLPSAISSVRIALNPSILFGDGGKGRRHPADADVGYKGKYPMGPVISLVTQKLTKMEEPHGDETVCLMHSQHTFHSLGSKLKKNQNI